MTSKRTVFLAFLVASLCVSALAIETPKNARGFNPDGLYQFGNIDSVNLFNGNVIVNLPIGQHYDVTSQFGYQLMLSYNSSIWDVYSNIFGSYGTCSGDEGVMTYIPNQRSNAGAGWSLGYGRLLPACHLSNELFAAVYESPDGGAHAFTSTPDGSPLNSNYNGAVLTDDNSHLRLRNSKSDAPGPAYLDFPDGTTYTYTKNACNEWLLESMKDAFGNTVSVTWDSTHLTETILDPYHRKTVIHYVVAEPNDAYYTIVDSVDVPTFTTSPAQEDATFSTYHFHYAYPRLATRFVPGAETCQNASFVTPVLLSIDLPDLSTFVMARYPDNLPMHTLALPTGGIISWDSVNWQIPGDTCKAQNFLEGLATRKFRDPITGVEEVWSYSQVLDPGPFDSNGSYCEPLPFPSGDIPQWPKEQSHTIVTSPKGDKTVHYFSVFGGRGGIDSGDPFNSPNGFNLLDFGLPFTHLEQRAGLSLLLSTREYDCKGIACDDSHPDRSTYVKYELHPNLSFNGIAQDALPTTSRTYFESDTPAGTRYTETAQDDYDGYGHYRKVTASGNFGAGSAVQSRTVTTNYNGAEAEVGTSNLIKPGSGTWAPGFVPYPETEPWILGTYTSITTEEAGIKAKQLFFFNRADGFLKRTRVRRGTQNGSGVFSDSGSDTHDLITVFEKTASTTDPAYSDGRLIQPVGEVASETRYGGDVFPLASCAEPCVGQNALENFPVSSGSTTNRTYAYGTLATEIPAGAPFKTVDATIERNTGAPRTFTDPASHVRTMEYDGMSRISKDVLPSGLVVKYLYANAGSTNHATASVTAFAPTDLSTPLTQTTYDYDAFGRVDSILKLMPGSGSVSHSDSVWNSLGQKLSQTEPALVGDTGVQTAYTYDAFGRITSVTPPDGAAHVVSNSYAGIRATTTTIGAGTGGIGSELVSGNVVEHPVSKTVENDSFGRLTTVTESSQNGGVTTTASYNYDVLNHLAKVTMTAAEGTQNRSFTFDNRGMLAKESHPEMGETTYDKYDVYGHALHKLQGAANGQFDLSFVYDIYQRLAEVRQGSTGQTLIKQMTYDTLPTGDPGAPYTENGQLVKSYRRNYHSELGGDVPVYSYFHYDTSGRLDQKTTAIGGGPSFAQNYTYDILSEVKSLQYPNCSGCTPIASGAAIPTRTIDFRWSHGYLIGVDQGQTHFTSSTTPISYWPNGMVKDITHVAADDSHPVTDSQTLDQGMSRPATITFTGATDTDCPAPGATITGPATISAFATGSASAPTATGVTYAWTIDGGTFTSATNAASVTFTAGCSGNVSVGVSVTASCGTTASRSLQIPITGGTAPTGVSISGAPTGTQQSPVTVQLTATASGSPTGYQWYHVVNNVAVAIPNATSAAFTETITTTTVYRVRASNGCGATNSSDATVTVQSCGASATVSGGANITIGQSAQIQAAFTGTSPWSITWSDGQPQSGITQNPFTRTVTPTTTTTYTITSVTDGAGCSGTWNGSSATVTVASLQAPTFSATTRTGNSSYTDLAWSAVPGAAWYQLEWTTRVTNNFQPVFGHLTGTSTYIFSGGFGAPATFLYRIRSGVTIGGADYLSAPSALDYTTVATTLFTDDPIQPGVTVIKGVHLSELRHAIDSVRIAAGLSAVFSYAPATGPVTANDNLIARQKLDEAVNILLGHGVAYSGQTPAVNGTIWAYQYQQIREGVK